MRRLAVIGAGSMARVRARALLASKQVTVCGVAARRLARARQLADELGCELATDDYRELAKCGPEAVLVEVPHGVQDRIVLWALGAGLHVFIGGCLAGSAVVGREICVLARRGNRVVECGYEARYSACWEAARARVQGGELGDLVAARSLALWAGDPATWYYRQEDSGGMPLTHMTYCFLNPLRWILGRPVRVSAAANRKCQTGPEMIREETCVANVVFENDVPCTLTAGFVKPADYPAWSVTLFGTRGILDVFPDEQGGGGSVCLYRGKDREMQDFSRSPNAFDVQAATFVQAINGVDGRRNPPTDALEDVRVAEAIVQSVREGQTIAMGP